jgi:hypothetical protein
MLFITNVHFMHIVATYIVIYIVNVSDTTSRCTASPIQPVKYRVVFYIYMCLCACCMWFKKTVLNLLEMESLAAMRGYIPVGGSSEDVYKHSAGEHWASDISRRRTWDWDGAHCVCTSQTPPWLKWAILLWFVNADLKEHCRTRYLCMWIIILKLIVSICSYRLKKTTWWGEICAFGLELGAVANSYYILTYIRVYVPITNCLLTVRKTTYY